MLSVVFFGGWGPFWPLSVVWGLPDLQFRLSVLLERRTSTLSVVWPGGLRRKYRQNSGAVGPLGRSLPTSDARITAMPGDLMLHQGNQLTLMVGENSWSYTRLGHVEGIGGDELSALLGEGDVSITLSR